MNNTTSSAYYELTAKNKKVYSTISGGYSCTVSASYNTILNEDYNLKFNNATKTFYVWNINESYYNLQNIDLINISASCINGSLTIKNNGNLEILLSEDKLTLTITNKNENIL